MGNRHWTSEEVAVLHREWHELSARALKKHLPGRTWTAITRRAQDDGLPGGVPQGRISITALAVRCGVPHPVMLRVLEWAGITPTTFYPERRLTQRKSTRRHVEIDSALEAYKRWLRTETAEQAARRLGVSGNRMRERAVRAGASTGDGKWTRLYPEQWDRLNAIKAWTRGNAAFQEAIR